MGKTINKYIVKTKVELKAKIEELEESQNSKINRITEKVNELEREIEKTDAKIETAVNKVNKTAKAVKKNADEKILQMVKIVENFKEIAAGGMRNENPEVIPRVANPTPTPLAQIIQRNIALRIEP